MMTTEEREEYNRRRREKRQNSEKLTLANRMRSRRYHWEHHEEVLSKMRDYRNSHKEEARERNRRYREEHKEEMRKKDKEYYERNKKEIALKNSTKEGKANIKEISYRTRDKQRGFNTENNITKEWILENIFNGQKCIYCGETDWTKLGADRIDNNKPHTPDNVVCSCTLCNKLRGSRMSVEEFMLERKKK